MRVLLDTHVFLWWVEGDTASLTNRVRRAIADPGNECLLSVASVWELCIKASIGKLKLALPVERYVVEHVALNSFRLLDIGVRHLGKLQSLAFHHRDPFDRLLVAQALQEDLPLVTADPVFSRYGVKRLW